MLDRKLLLNGKVLQTRREVLPHADILALAGFAPQARVEVRAKTDAMPEHPIERGEYAAVSPGLVLTVRFRV